MLYLQKINDILYLRPFMISTKIIKLFIVYFAVDLITAEIIIIIILIV
jgi:hypothetical protein